MSRTLRSTVVWVGLVLVLSLVYFSTGIAQSAPTISISPDSGLAGIGAVVTGYGWVPNYVAPPNEIHWNRQDGKLLGGFTPNTNGGWTSSITIPADASAGEHEIWACTRCDSKPIWAMTKFKIISPPTSTPTRTPTITSTPVPPTLTPTPEPPTDCDATGMAGEIIVDFERFDLGWNLKGLTIPEGITFSSEQNVTVVDPGVDAHSGTKALKAGGAMEFGSSGIPVHLEFTHLQEFVGVYVGLDEPADFNRSFTAVMRAYGLSESGVRYFAGEDKVTLGGSPEAVKKCLSVSDPRIYEVYIDYEGVSNLELMDDILLRGPVERIPVPLDDEPPIVIIDTPLDGSTAEPPVVRVQGVIYEDRDIVKVDFLVNGEIKSAGGAFYLGDGPDGKKKFGFLWNGIPLDYLTQCENQVEVLAFDSAGNSGINQALVRHNPGDLSILNVEAVQVVYNAPLVKGKGTAFRATIASDFRCPVDVKFRLTLPQSMWSRAAVPSTMIGMAYGAPTGWELPEITLPFTVPEGDQELEVMLPIVPPGMEDAAWNATTNPAGLIGFVRQVPRPIADSVNFEVEIDPENLVIETDETNNRFTSPNYEVKTTRPFTVAFVPWFFNFEPRSWETESYYKFYLDRAGYTDIDTRISNVRRGLTGGKAPITAALSADEITRMKNTTDQFGALLLGGFPVADAKYSYYFASHFVYFREDYYDAHGIADLCGSGRFIIDMRNMVMAANPAVDYVILELPTGCCGQSSDRAAYVDGGVGLIDPTLSDWFHYCVAPPPATDPAVPTPTAWPFPYGGAGVDTVLHESAHVWNGAPDCYGCYNGGPPDSNLDCSFCSTDEDGFWVNSWQAYESGNGYFMYAVSSDIRWWRLESLRRLSGSEYPDGYRKLIESFADASDPQALLVHGSITRAGTATLQPFQILENAYLDYQPGAEGDYYFVLKDAVGGELVRTGFNLAFEISDSLSQTLIPVEEAYFSLRLAWDPATRVIELQDKDGKQLAARNVSSNAPQVAITNPIAGLSLAQNAELTVEWSASDADGDPLLASVHISSDGGSTWYPAGTELEGSSYELPMAAFQVGDSVLVRVVVTDGVNTAAAVSTSPVMVTEPLATETTGAKPGLKVGLLVYYGIAALLVIAVVVWLLLRRRAKAKTRA